MNNYKADRAELVGYLRKATGVSDSIASDDELLQKTEVSFIRAEIELGMALQDALRAFKAALPSIVHRLFF